MILFTFSCVGILLFLWLSFGGAIPLKPQSYRFSAKIAEAPTLAEEADVRMAGVNIGKVKTKELDKGAARTIVEMEVNPDFAPIAKDSKVILRQKTLLGESYIEVSPGHRRLNGQDEHAGGRRGAAGRLRSRTRWSSTRSSPRSTATRAPRSRPGSRSWRTRSRAGAPPT